MKNRIYYVIAVLFLVAFITTFNYGGCNIPDGGTSGSSTLPAVTLPSVTTNPATNITQTTATLNGMLNPNGLNVTSCYFDYGTSVSYGSQQSVVSLPGSGTSLVSVDANVLSLLSSTQYNFRVVGTNSSGTNYGNNRTFTTLGPPTCTTYAADNITTNSARLNGTVNPNGTVTTAYFNYGLTTSYTVTTTLQTLGGGTSNINVTANISGLSATTTYNFRVVGTNSFGTTYGNNLTFTTGAPFGSAPTCTTDPADNITTNLVRLNGTVNPNGAATNVYFGYGISATPITYLLSTTPQAIGIGNTSVAITATAGSLTPNTLYNFRVVATNAGGTTNGLNQTFNTTAVPTTAVDNYCWVANRASNNVTRITKSTSNTTTIAVGTGPKGVAVDSNYVWVANYGSNNVTRIKKSDLTTTTITAGSYPCGIAVDETYCWVANNGSANITRILKADLTTTTIAVVSGPSGVAVDGTYCWVANNGVNNISRIKKSDLTATTITVETNPRGVAVDANYVWVTNMASNNVTRINKSDLTTTTIAVGSPSYEVMVDQTYAWVTTPYSNNVIRIKKSELTTTTIAAGTDPFGVAVDETYVWVANNPNGNGTVTRILKSDLTTTTIAVGTNPYSGGDMTGYAYDNYSRVP